MKTPNPLIVFFAFSILPKKGRKENNSTWSSIVVKSNIFRSVFARIEDTKKIFWNQLTFKKSDHSAVAFIQN